MALLKKFELIFIATVIVGSSPSTANTQNEVAFGVYGRSGDEGKDSQFQRKQIVRKVIQDGSPKTPVRMNATHEIDETDIVMVSELVLFISLAAERVPMSILLNSKQPLIA